MPLFDLIPCLQDSKWLQFQGTFLDNVVREQPTILTPTFHQYFSNMVHIMDSFFAPLSDVLTLFSVSRIPSVANFAEFSGHWYDNAGTFIPGQYLAEINQTIRNILDDGLISNHIWANFSWWGYLDPFTRS